MAYMHLLAAVLTIQIGLRRWQLNCRVSARMLERRSREASAAAAAAAEAERDGAERAAVEEKQRKERASFGAIKVSRQDHGLPKARAESAGTYCHIQIGGCRYVMACSPARLCMSVVPYVLQGSLLEGWATHY